MVKIAKAKYKEYDQAKGVELLMLWLKMRSKNVEEHQRWRQGVYAMEECDGELKKARGRL